MSTITNSPGRTAPDEDGAILDAVGKWLERDVRPHVHALEHDDIYPREMVEQMKALGLFGATIGTAYGGLGARATTPILSTAPRRGSPTAFTVRCLRSW